MADPKISIVLPVYNAAAFVGDAVESMLAQRFGDFELLLINDGSRDGSRDVLASFRDDRIRLIDQENRGLVETLNRGIREARGEWVARMDADDISLPERLAAQVRVISAHPELALLGSFVETMDEAGHTLAEVVRFPEAHDDIWRALGRRPWVMVHPTVIYRRQVALEIGLYNAAYRHAEDTEFFARLMSRYQAANMPEVLLRYRLRVGSVCTAYQGHGAANATAVARIIDRWKKGEPFVATSQERAAAERAIARHHGLPPRKAQSIYLCRTGRELLRGKKWSAAAAAYGRAALLRPLGTAPYVGLAAAMFRQGGTPPLKPTNSHATAAPAHRAAADAVDVMAKA